METCDNFGLGFWQIKGCPVYLGNSGYEEDKECDEGKRRSEDEPTENAVGLACHDLTHAQTFHEHHNGQDRETERDFITDDLGGGA